MRFVRSIPVSAMSLTFVACADPLAGTWELTAAERDGDDFTASYLQTVYNPYYTNGCGSADTVGLTIFEWNAGFWWRSSPGCYSDPSTYAQYMFVDRRIGGFTLAPYTLDAEDEAIDCRRKRSGLDCLDPGNGRPITFRFRPREGA